MNRVVKQNTHPPKRISTYNYPRLFPYATPIKSWPTWAHTVTHLPKWICRMQSSPRPLYSDRYRAVALSTITSAKRLSASIDAASCSNRIWCSVLWARAYATLLSTSSVLKPHLCIWRYSCGTVTTPMRIQAMWSRDNWVGTVESDTDEYWPCIHSQPAMFLHVYTK